MDSVTYQHQKAMTAEETRAIDLEEAGISVVFLIAMLLYYFATN